MNDPIAHTSLLTRANVTLQKVLEAIGQTDLSVQKTWRLNERHYGALTGLNKVQFPIRPSKRKSILVIGQPLVTAHFRWRARLAFYFYGNGNGFTFTVRHRELY